MRPIATTPILLTYPGMGLSSDTPPSAPSSKPKLAPEERLAREAERRTSVRLRIAIGRALDERGITDPSEIASAFGMSAREAMKLLNRHQWREGDVTQLQALAERLGVQVPDARPERL